jgi:hypothetical protein
MSVQSGLLARIKGRSFRRFQPPKRQAKRCCCSSWSLEIFALKCPYHCRSSCPCGKPQNSPIDAHLHAHDGFRPRGFLVEKAVESDRRAHAYPGRTPLFLVVKKAFKRVLGLPSLNADLGQWVGQTNLLVRNWGTLVAPSDTKVRPSGPGPHRPRDASEQWIRWTGTVPPARRGYDNWGTLELD